MEFSARDFRDYVDVKIEDAEKDELLRALWCVAVTFVDLSWGVESVQRALAASERARKSG
jgi:hypothetical protein